MLNFAKKIALFSALLVGATRIGFCDEPVEKPVCKRPCIQPTIEAKAGYFFFSDSTMRDVYDEGGWDVQLCGSYPVWRWVQVYASVEYLQKNGKSLNGNENTSIWEIPISLGPKTVIKIIPEVEYYFTIGPRYFFVQQTNNSSYVSRHVSNDGLGMFVNTGFNFIVLKHLLIDVFGEYSYKQMQFSARAANVESSSVNVGGFTFGGGLGYAF